MKEEPKKAAPAAKKPAAKAEEKKAAPAPKAEPKKAAPAAKAEPAKKPEPKKEEPAEDDIDEEATRANGKFEIKRTSDGRYMFNVRAGNTQIIASSQIYSSMSACKNGIASVGANAAAAGIEDQTLQSVNEEKCPKFQIYLDKGGKFRFNLVATNGQTILSCSQGYVHKSSCKNGINSVINNANAPVVVLENDK